MRTSVIRASLAILALTATASAAQPATMAAIPMCSAAAVQASTAPTAPPQAPSQATPRDAMGYVAKAGASDLYEIQSSQLAQQKGASDAVRRFAAMMIEHHTMTTQQVTAAARAAGMTPQPPALEPHQQTMIAELQGLSGAAFDAAYVRQQRTAHDMALALHSNYAKDGDTRELRATADKAVPIIRRHIEQLRSMPGR
jgi:putative membrane protein